MKTLKKVLCLVLALVMVAGTMAISAAAFDDDKDITNKDAAAVLNGIKVITGYDGKFDPDGKLTRDQGAAIITRLLQAGDLKLETKFADVKGLWSESVVAYCENEGIVSGYGDGLYHPGDTLTAVQFAKMVLVALGYDAKAEGLEGETFYNNTVKLATKVGINVKAAAWGEAITRENAAQMAFNALTVSKVEYEGNNTVINLGDVGTITTSSRVVETKKTLAEDFNLDLEGGKLATEPGREKDGTPNYTYTADDGEEDVATVAVEPNYTYTVKTVADDADEGETAGYTKIAAAINKDLGLKDKNVLEIKGDDYYDVFVNGVEIDNETTYELKVGDTVKLFTEKKTINTVVILRAAFAKVDEIKTLTEAEIKEVLKANEDDKHTVEYTLSNGAKFNDVTFPGFDYEKDQYITYVAVDGKVVSSEAATLVTGKIAGIKGNTYRIGSTYYGSAMGALALAGKDDDASTYALDAEGKLAAIVVAAEDTSKVSDYIFVYNTHDVDPVPGEVNEDGVAEDETAGYIKLYGIDAKGTKVVFNTKDDTIEKGDLVAYKIDKDGYLVAADQNVADTLANVASAKVNKSDNKLVDDADNAKDVYVTSSTVFFFVSQNDKKVFEVKKITGYTKVDVDGAVSYISSSTKAPLTANTVFVLDAYTEPEAQKAPGNYAVILSDAAEQVLGGYEVSTSAGVLTFDENYDFTAGNVVEYSVTKDVCALEPGDGISAATITLVDGTSATTSAGKILALDKAAVSEFKDGKVTEKTVADLVGKDVVIVTENNVVTMVVIGGSVLEIDD